MEETYPARFRGGRFIADVNNRGSGWRSRGRGDESNYAYWAAIHLRCFITPSFRIEPRLRTSVTYALQAAQNSPIDDVWESCTLVPTKPHRDKLWEK